jgi:hypothetical protein
MSTVIAQLCVDRAEPPLLALRLDARGREKHLGLRKRGSKGAELRRSRSQADRAPKGGSQGFSGATSLLCSAGVSGRGEALSFTRYNPVPRVRCALEVIGSCVAIVRVDEGLNQRDVSGSRSGPCIRYREVTNMK